MAQMRYSVAVALAATLMASSLRPAHALIVVDVKIVPAWPDQAPAAAPAGAQLATANIGLYPQPRGTIYGLTLLIDFSDAAPAFDKTEIDAWLNQQGYTAGGLNGSVRDYFSDQSNEMIDFRNDIFGFYRAKHPKSYYEGKPGYSGSDELFAEMLDYFDDSIDFSKYDNDGDGRTDALSVVYAGAAETWGQGLWPHASGSNQKRNGVTIARYMMSNLGSSLGLYTFSHEVGHMLFGWPDLYGFGNYCIMGNSSSAKNPVGINDFYRADQGWIPLVDVTASTNLLLTAVPNGAGFRYTNPRAPQESFFWSNVQSSGRFSTISGDGLLLLHFDKRIGRNDPPSPLSLAVVQADGKKDLDQTMWPSPGSDAKDFFHAGGTSEFSEQKFTTAKWNDGTSSGLRIYDIGPISEQMQFKVGKGPIVPEPVGGSGGAAGAAGAAAGGVAGVGGAGASGAPGGEGGAVASGGSGSGGVSGAASVGGGGAGGAPQAAGASQGGVSVAGSAPSSPSNAGVGLAAGAGGASGASGTAALDPPGAAEDASCACRNAATPSRSGWALLLGTLVLGLQRRRRKIAENSRG